MNFLDFLYPELLVDEMTLRVVLPETVSNIKVDVPFEVERLPDEILKTYLDTSGRTVLVLRKKNLVEGYIQDFTVSWNLLVEVIINSLQVYYDFNMLNMIREPAMLVAAFMIFFTVIIIYVRLDFSISEVSEVPSHLTWTCVLIKQMILLIFQDKMGELQQRAQASVDEIISLQSKRSAIYQAFEDAVSSYKSSKDADRFKSDLRKVEVDYKSISQKISTMQSKLREFYAEGAEKVRNLI